MIPGLLLGLPDQSPLVNLVALEVRVRLVAPAGLAGLYNNQGMASAGMASVGMASAGMVSAGMVSAGMDPADTDLAGMA